MSCEHSINQGVEGKICSTCKNWKALASYSNRTRSTDGLSYSCKDCDREAARKSYKNRRAKLERMRELGESSRV